jgi:dephospho-CoA kinase
MARMVIPWIPTDNLAVAGAAAVPGAVTGESGPVPSCMTLVVALTGNIASGKSEVARLLARRGAVLIDSDVLAREVVAPGTAGLRQIVDRWGTGVVMPNGELDRAALRRRVFADAREREALNAIVHPRIAARRDLLLAEARERGVRLVVCDIPLLFETGLQREFDRVILVDAPAEIRRQRLRARGLSNDEAERMMAAQMPAEDKRAAADIVIDNDGTLEALEGKVASVWNRLLTD